MSSFQGKIEEIPEISVDRFDGENLSSEAYFLSHCHTDHMIGIGSSEFKDTLQEKNCFIYVSPVSKAILKQLYPYLEKSIKELEFHAPNSIHLKNKCISVIPIPSGHCPGSVMFLFESNKNVLYTGDYRLKLEDITKIKAFYDAYNKLKKIHKLYLDTTFFFKDYMKFPTREESLGQIISLIKEWMALGEEYIIHLILSAKYGYEYVFMEIFNKIKMPIHINPNSFDFYSLIPQLDGAVTLKNEHTKLHCNCGHSYNKMCDVEDKYKVKTIKMSAMRWKNEDLEDGLITMDLNRISVCYSTHASYKEGVELIKFLKPEAIEPCVLRNEENLNSQIYDTIDALLKANNEEDEPIVKKPKLFDLKKIENFHSSRISINQKAKDIFEEALDSPPETQLSP